jgi:hypothetical protein
MFSKERIRKREGDKEKVALKVRELEVKIKGLEVLVRASEKFP